MSKVLSKTSLAQMICSILFLMSGSGITSTTALAGVNLPNGNYNVSFTDLYRQNSNILKLERTYNSVAQYDGLWGWGWGTIYETRLKLEDKRLVINEYGEGQSVVFGPDAPPGTNGEQSLASIPQDEVFSASTGETQSLRRDGANFTRSFLDGHYQQFDNQGRLIKIHSQAEGSIDLEWDKSGRLLIIKEDAGRTISLSYNGQKHVTHAQDSTGARSAYSYNSRGELTQCRSATGDIYQYLYAGDGFHSLISIGYPDGSESKIWYYPDDYVKAIKERDDVVTLYRYEVEKSGSAVERRVFVSSLDINAASKSRSVSSFQYFYKVGPEKEEVLTRKIERTVDKLTETSYDEKFGAPVLIERKEQLRNSLDSQGRVVPQETNTYIQEFAYTFFGKVSAVRRYEALEPTHTLFFATYAYDDAQRLIAIHYEDGDVSLAYDHAGRIIMLTADGHMIRYSYNQEGQPTQIEVDGGRYINVGYGKSGTVPSVTAADQHKGDLVRLVSELMGKLTDLVGRTSPSRSL